MDVVLDLDLDFFVSPVASYPDGGGRLTESDFKSATVGETSRFLENSCHLSESALIPGRQVVEHEDSFRTWRQWIADDRLRAPFEVVHVDAHADLGMGCPGWTYLASELLALKVTERSNPHHGEDALNSCNYLLFAIANGWVGRLTYVYPKARGENPANGSPDDLWGEIFRDQDPTSGKIELKRYSRKDAKNVLGGTRANAIAAEPAVPFTFVRAAGFAMTGVTHMVVAQSPRFTTEAADQLLPVIRKYFRPA
jgi:hypothetical protein